METNLTERLSAHSVWLTDRHLNREPRGSQLNLSGADLRGASLRGICAASSVLSGAAFVGADLQGADLRDASLDGADMRGADLRGADLQDAVFVGADLRGADLRGARNIIWARFDLAASRPVLAWAALDDEAIQDLPQSITGRGAWAPLSEEQEAVDRLIEAAVEKANADLAPARAKRESVKEQRAAANAALMALTTPISAADFTPNTMPCPGCADCDTGRRWDSCYDRPAPGHAVPLYAVDGGAQWARRVAQERLDAEVARRGPALPAAIERVREAHNIVMPYGHGAWYSAPVPFASRREAAIAATEARLQAEDALAAAQSALAGATESMTGALSPSAISAAAVRLAKAAEATGAASDCLAKATATEKASLASLREAPSRVRRECEEWAEMASRMTWDGDGNERRAFEATTRWLAKVAAAQEAATVDVPAASDTAIARATMPSAAPVSVSGRDDLFMARERQAYLDDMARQGFAPTGPEAYAAAEKHAYRQLCREYNGEK